MHINRREFTTGAIALAASGAMAGPAAAQLAPGLSPQQRALGAIRDYTEAHLRWFNLPGLTLGVTSPGGFSSVINAGLANIDARTPITPDTLFQIGSISKSFTSATLHQFAAEGRLKLSDRIVKLLPGTPLPANSPIEVQHLLDHVAGLPGDPPLFVRGGLWSAYAPGRHWHYSNTGYELLGKLAEHVGGKPLDRLLAARLFAPLGMTRTRGSLNAAERLLYAQGYEPADLAIPFVRGDALRPAAWVNSTSAAGSIASTAADMLHYMQNIAGAAQGKGGMGLGPKAALAYASHQVPSDSPEMAYGNGLMHVEDNGRRYIHHTGGMVSFSSSFHVDSGNAIGAFASTNLSAFPEYRPRKVTLFAVQALAAAEAGQQLPDPPPLQATVKKPEDYVGRYSSGSRSFEIRAGQPLAVVSNGQQAALELAGDDLFVTNHPGFRDFTLMFERSGGEIIGAAWGPESFARAGATMKVAASDPGLARLAGTYVNDSPWNGTAVVVERGGKLWLGTDTPMVRIGKNLWRIGDKSWSPERASFADTMNGRPQTFIFSGTEFARQDR
jgi:CubicO group peptidase (beta-lactamase class C family)